jgi:Zn-dependent protease
MAVDLNDQLISLVARVLRTESVIWGESSPGKPGFLAHFRGQMINQESEAAYDQLAGWLRPKGITPLFRSEGGQHHIFLIQGVHEVKPSNVAVNLVLFALTVVSVFLAGMLYSYRGPLDGDFATIWPHLVSTSGLALAFTVSLLSILLAHEFGHYLVARRHHTAATLPYFIPFPFSPFGTMGAVIVQKESHKNRRVLLDIGIAGPLAGLVVTIPVLLIGLYYSELGTIDPSPASGLMLEGNSILYLLAKYLIFGQLLPAPAGYGDMAPPLYWLIYFFTGQPAPLGGTDVLLHPVAFAGWAGLLVTALNLIPAGQLDGGHILHSLLGRRALLLLPAILVALVALGFFWNVWWFWALLIFFMGRAHAEPLDQITQLDGKRRLLAVLAMLIFFLTFTPVPMRLF